MIKLYFKIVLMLLMFGLDVNAQDSISVADYLSGLKYNNTPITLNKRFKNHLQPEGRIIHTNDSSLVVNLYKDIQQRKKIKADSTFRVLYKVQMSNSINSLYLFEYGKPDSFRRQMLFIITPEGEVLDSLEVGVYYGANLAVKQHYLRNNNDLMVYELFSYNNEGDELDKLKSFKGGRFDTRYEIKDNKFKPKTSYSYYGTTYSRSFLENRFYDLWEGEETRYRLSPDEPQRLRVIAFSDSIGSLGSCDKLPIFPGGEIGLLQYVGRTSDRLIPFTGGHMSSDRVVVSFIVDTEGYALNPKIIREGKYGDKDMNRAALQTINQMPRWKPAIKKGKSVAIEYLLPIHFRGY